MTREELIAALEEATEGSRQLDVDIFRFIGLTEVQERHCRQWCRMDGRRTDLTREHYLIAWAPDFTTSLDAALSRVPKGWHLSSLHQRDPSVTHDVNSAKLSPDNTNDKGWEHGTITEQGASLALALCIAALKARATKPETGAQP